jgi:protein-L-isoaspartate(D-aspartate) O-methyltransferase
LGDLVLLVSHPTDHTLARRQMVDGQLRPNRITNPALLQALGDLPREMFVPSAQSARVYADAPVPIAPWRWLLAPMTMARLVQLAAPRRGERALVAGGGSGYGAALLAALELSVVAVEDDPALLRIAAEALAAVAPGVRLVTGAPASGCAEAAPFDLILIEGAVPAIPTALAAQLAPGGRVVAVAGPDASHGRAVLGQLVGGTFSVTGMFDLAAPPLPGFAAPAHFVL